ncbi:helix-hairpin-helix domain-containing protein [Dyadobacter sp. CY312]|uniref:ComEA family DNA-binding protein n=1 Tax=Dyadobacter sp. CY312 TaxID=2907303 RepID=UPI001F361FDE|nr:helix-hairpin-helix domain-containing protein [Dyadobacter sp. CY312]MCE7040696.1 helix-hairpin-helix domain-containing protein [Dyadobacter sp. CY312]
MIQRIISQLQDFFGISRKEARGTLVLMIILFFLIWTPFVFRRWILPHFPLPATDQSANIQKLDSIVAEIEEATPKSYTENNFKESSSSKKPTKPARLFSFDPNQATVDELTELGIPPFLAKRIDKYRSKGGKFRKKEDLLHIYDFPADVYKTLEPYITLPATPDKSFAEKSNANIAEKATNRPFINERKPYTKPVIASFDINTADTTQLVILKGIGSKLSLRILKFRDGLGGFHSTSQYSEIYGLDSLALSELNKYAKVNSPTKKINVNTATIEELSSHSYLRNKKLAAVIINYRAQHGNYNSLEDLKKVRVLDAGTIEKLAPYLTF